MLATQSQNNVVIILGDIIRLEQGKISEMEGQSQELVSIKYIP